MLAVQAPRPDGEISTLVIDCGGDVIQRLCAAEIDLESIDHVLVSHEHADHVSGFTLMVQKLWLAGRRRPINVHGIGAALAQARRVWDAFDTSSWKEQGLPDLLWNEYPHKEDSIVLEDGTWLITASPALHTVPTSGYRIEHVPTGRVLAYSCDTAPSGVIARLGQGAHLFIHEANGSMPGVHSSAEEAARVAADAGAHRLVLVHLPPGLTDNDLTDARRAFGEVSLGVEMDAYEV